MVTSFTSSLKRLRLASLPWKTGLFARTSLRIDARLITPSITAEPAMVPSLGTLKRFLTSALPIFFSVRIGSSRSSIILITPSSSS